MDGQRGTQRHRGGGKAVSENKRGHEEKNRGQVEPGYGRRYGLTGRKVEWRGRRDKKGNRQWERKERKRTG